jgi:hypothetical protein
MLVVLMLMATNNPILQQGVAGLRTDALEVQVGGVVLRTGEPGVIFGVVRIAKGKRFPAYVILVRHRVGKEEGANESSEEVVLEDRIARSRHSLLIEGKRLHLHQRIELAPDGAKILREEFRFGDKTFDPSNGRVFVLDLTGGTPRWEQRKLDLPSEVGELDNPRAAEEFARTQTTELSRQDRKIKAFVEGK